MALKQQEPQHDHFAREHKDQDDIAELSDRLAPPEEINSNFGSERESRDDDGTLVVDTGALKFPKGFVENEQEKRGILGLEPVIVLILSILLAFIGLIAYFVYKMPASPK